MLTLLSTSVEETITIGKRLGSLLGAGDFIALVGELGSGKTHFAMGVAAGIGVDPTIHVTSPTYTLMNIYQGRLPLYHFDLYRLTGDQDVADLGFEEYFYGRGVSLVEWAERLQELLPEDRLVASFHHLDELRRKICLEPHGRHYEEIIRQLGKS